MNAIKKIFKGIAYILLIPFLYIFISLILSWISVDRIDPSPKVHQPIYLTTNGVHLNIVLHKKHLNSALRSGLKLDQGDQYLSFGWGDENFYLNTPQWSDLTLGNAFNALFLKSKTLMHVTRYQNKQNDWVRVEVSQAELQKLNDYILNTFTTDINNHLIRLKHQGYTSRDDFYKAKGSYSLFKTCNTWVNTGFKKSGLKSCLWTPFDFGLLDKYE
ncbi:MAG: DUF2459 domain-containing protein [Bacteroidetes bacterium]|jgi:uncharacterized protein (TIGR02117 family)|nr:DUF2459 domain-containing protein [Bacteroidota bacterium]